MSCMEKIETKPRNPDRFWIFSNISPKDCQVSPSMFSNQASVMEHKDYHIIIWPGTKIIINNFGNDNESIKIINDQ